jgi:hypothetical protein
MDIMGPLPMDQGNFKFVVVAVEYFTKWIEERPIAVDGSYNKDSTVKTSSSR